VSTTKERMKSGEAFVGMKRRGSQLFLLISIYVFFWEGVRLVGGVPSKTEHG
jgi:hypothetical protein